MLLEPPLHRHHSTLVRLWRWVRAVEDAYLVEQKNRYSTSFTLADLCAGPMEERFNVLPDDVCAGRVSEDRFESPLIGTLHSRTVPNNGTDRNIKPALHRPMDAPVVGATAALGLKSAEIKD